MQAIRKPIADNSIEEVAREPRVEFEVIGVENEVVVSARSRRRHRR
jgi:hypothetical protein